VTRSPGRSLLRGYKHGTCRYCGEPAKPPRRYWCSQTCVDAYLVRASQKGAREAVARRDHGVCAQCGRDCASLSEAVARVVRRINRGANGYWRDTAAGASYEAWQATKAWRIRVAHALSDAARLSGWGPLLSPSRRPLATWEADHIVPVVEGGGGTGLDNLRTLCRPCHRAATAELRRRRRKVAA
jgi:5-methylcytosine-specific restriction protein A